MKKFETCDWDWLKSCAEIFNIALQNHLGNTFKPFDIYKKMNNQQVYIHSGSNADNWGRIQSSQYDHDLNTTTYRVLIPGSGPQHPMDYIMEETPDRYVTVEAGHCAIYHGVGSWVKILSGGYSGYSGRVTAVKYNDEGRYYDVTVRIPESAFETHWSDYLPHDVDVTLRGHSLA